MAVHAANAGNTYALGNGQNNMLGVGIGMACVTKFRMTANGGARLDPACHGLWPHREPGASCPAGYLLVRFLSAWTACALQAVFSSRRE
ncbi:hypothetical protein R69746_08432 [Paraburkholderia aspalathi]|uniref:hypothetical protein n=1 Tax=Paraburkholderia aspalathi TaxID=1324617 RepID=UPI00190C5561|nr:hypothetical protein [Paraburkholderia aspalathi]MBK3844325.1 hypothetical protein [Paraburkholderia aspalathi]CAE6869504.1 hypothetical protein R75465_08185 [Paraburkholderia aspalathi]CAE6871046.1 hypothetical protein R69746_08432 [Paraburkholderia aspalathi]